MSGSDSEDSKESSKEIDTFSNFDILKRIEKISLHGIWIPGKLTWRGVSEFQ